MASLTFAIPGLFAPCGWRAGDVGEVSCRSFELLLARADASHQSDEPFHGYPHYLFRLFGIDLVSGQDAPVAAVTHLVDFDGGHEGIWMRADPVFLHADLHKLILFDSSCLDLSVAEAEALTSEINEVLGSPDWRIVFGKNHNRWYLKLDHLPGLMTRSPSEVAGHHIDPSLPVGPDATQWRRIANEIQMLLHASAVNVARERCGKPPINGVWFWGGGALPVPATVRWAKVYGTDALVQGLAGLCGCSFGGEVASAAELSTGLKSGDVLLLVLDAGQGADSRSDPEKWREFIQGLEERFFKDMVRLLRSGRLDSLTIDVLGDEYVINRKGLLRFWRRRRPIASYVGSRA